MGLRDRLRHLERAAEGEAPLVVCLECGEEVRIRSGIMLDLVALEWKMHHDGAEEPPTETPRDVRWVWEHPHDALKLVDKATGEPTLGHKWAEGVRALTR
jgi:hypothetical protein